jgi:hypothetical protein
MGEIFGAVGSIAAASMQAAALKKATEMQIAALEKQAKFIYDELEPGKISGLATDADVKRAKDQRALAEILDPALAAARYEAESKILEGVRGLGPDSTAMRVGEQAATEALAGIPQMDELKARLIDTALQELDLGGTLPPDVQAELVKAGLEKSGLTTGVASPQGIGGTMLRQILGTAGLQLRQQRQQQASALAGQAQNLEASRQNILQQLFPNLSGVQLGQLAGAQNVLGTAEALTPEAGLTGQDIANLWLKRVGATGEIMSQQANAAKSGALGQAQAWQTGINTAIPYITNSLPSTQSVWGSMFGPAAAAPASSSFIPAPYGGGSSYG